MAAKEDDHVPGTAADFDADWPVPTSDDGMTPGEEHMPALAVDHASLKSGGDMASNSLLMWVSWDAIECHGGYHHVLVAGEANAMMSTYKAGVATGGEGNGGATHFVRYHGCDVSAGTVSPSLVPVEKGALASVSCVSSL